MGDVVIDDIVDGGSSDSSSPLMKLCTWPFTLKSSLDDSSLSKSMTSSLSDSSSMRMDAESEMEISSSESIECAGDEHTDDVPRLSRESVDNRLNT